MTFKSALILILLLTLNGCKGQRQSTKKGHRPSSKMAALTNEELVDASWRRNERIVEAALNGVVVEDGFLKSSIFFEEITGIAIHGQGTFLGWLPNEQSKEDFQRIQAWYSENKNRLYWDPKLQKVRVHPVEPIHK